MSTPLEIILLHREIELCPKIDIVLLKSENVILNKQYHITNQVSWLAIKKDMTNEGRTKGYYIEVNLILTNKVFHQGILYFDYQTREFEWILPIPIHLNNVLFSHLREYPASEAFQKIVNHAKYKYIDFRRGSSKTYEWTIKKWYHFRHPEGYVEYRVNPTVYRDSFIIDVILNTKEKREQLAVFWKRGKAEIIKGNISDENHLLVSSLFLNPTIVEFK